MKPSIATKLENLASRLSEIDALLSSEEATRDMDQYRRMTREHAEITPVVERFREYQQAERDVAEAQGLLADPEMKEYAETELKSAKARIDMLEGELQKLLL